MEKDLFLRTCQEHPEWIPDEVVESEFTNRGLMTDDVLETYRSYIEDSEVL